ncbi:MAG: tetratricopeptide repeat protein, partial [Deltaproteobacteria bacterium]|nr:tetratricopeptide repeat protein [Deltaproteobacteria bacterium]
MSPAGDSRSEPPRSAEDDKFRLQVKDILGKVGQALAGVAANRTVVLRCATMEQAQQAFQLLNRAFPKIRWECLVVTSRPSFQKLLQEVVADGTAEERAFFLHGFPGEQESKGMTETAAELIAAAAKAGLGRNPLVLAVAPGSVRVLADKATAFWKSKAGYFAWPAPSKEPLSDAPAAPAPPPPVDATPLSDVPEPEETRQVLENFHGKEAADYLVRVARTHIERGDAEQARLFLLRAAQIYSQEADLGGMATCYHWLGISSQNRGDYDSAFEWFDQAIDNFRIINDRAQLSQSIAQKGYVYYLRSRFEQAVKAFDEALKIDQELNLTDRVSAGYRKIAMVLEMAGKLEAAEDLYQKSRALEEAAGNNAGVSRVLHHIGRLREAQGLQAEALVTYHESLEMKTREGDRAGMAATLHQIGNLHMKRGELDDAITHYGQAQEIEREIGDRPGLARTLAQLGLAYRDLGRIDDALAALVRAFQIFQKIRSPVASEVLAKVEELQDL